MADTLEKIYDNTLTASSFDSNGEATIITTDSSTRHVLKDIKVIEGDTQLPINGKLQDNGHDLVALSANSSGSEIIGPSSSVKVKSGNIPFTHLDHVIGYQTSTTETGKLKIPFINGLSGKASNETTTDTVHSNTLDNGWRQYWTGIGPNNNTVYFHNDGNSVNITLIEDSSGGDLFYKTTAYRRNYFDGTRYVYYIDSGYLRRVDAHTTTNVGSSGTAYIAASGMSFSSNPALFGYKDEIAIGWAKVNTDEIYLFDLVNATARQIGYHAQNTFVAGGGRANGPWGLVKRTDGTYVMISQYTANVLRGWIINKDTTTFTSNTTANADIQVSLEQNAQDIDCSMAYIGSRVYYVSNSSPRSIRYVDFETNSPTQHIVGDHIINYNGYDLWGKEETPDATTVSNRTYNVNPSLKLRITGVTST